MDTCEIQAQFVTEARLLRLRLEDYLLGVACMNRQRDLGEPLMEADPEGVLGQLLEGLAQGLTIDRLRWMRANDAR